MLTRESAIKLVKDFANEIKQTGLHLRKVILYGSYARNQQNEWSDIDVVLVADEFIGVPVLDLNYFIKIKIKKIYTIIQPQTFSTEYFNQEDPFVKEIKQNGLEVLEIPVQNEKEEWNNHSMSNLDNAYSHDEPNYDNIIVKEPNPDYKK
jgi:predicted nucleotidyltransferase